MTNAPLYRSVADRIESLIASGMLRAGMRAPSLRSLADQHGVSLSTALQAYRSLEDRGLLAARPKSGFYVTNRAEADRPLPSATRPPAHDMPVEITRHVAGILAHAANQAFAPLGCAIPSASLLAAERLDRHLARCARLQGRELNIYMDPHGDLALRQQIAERGLRLGHAVPPEGIIITNGCTEALSVALCAVTDPGDTVAIESPTYFGLLQIIEARGLRALELPTDPRRGVDVAALDQALNAHRVAACLLSSSFSNPLGCLTDDTAKAEIIGVLARHRVPLIEDDIYGDICFGRTRPRPFAAIDPAADIMLCSSFSKTIAPGYRVGWIAANRRRDDLIAAKFATSLCSPALPQRAMANFLQSGGYDLHLRRLRRTFADHIEHMRRTVARSFPADTRMSAPEGGFVLWLELAPGFPSDRLLERALSERICFVPGHLFTASGGYRHCLRLSCGHQWDARIERSVERLGELASEINDESARVHE